MRPNTVLITGATGLVGGALLRLLLERDATLHARVLVRDPERWLRALAELRVPVSRVTAIAGDVTRPGLGLPAGGAGQRHAHGAHRRAGRGHERALDVRGGVTPGGFHGAFGRRDSCSRGMREHSGPVHRNQNRR